MVRSCDRLCLQKKNLSWHSLKPILASIKTSLIKQHLCAEAKEVSTHDECIISNFLQLKKQDTKFFMSILGGQNLQCAS